MPNRQASIFMVAAFIVLGVLGLLAAVAIPHVSTMTQQSEARADELELLKIRSAVDDMLQQSPAGSLRAVGPVTDLSQVLTADDPPLSLKDYLPDGMKSVITSGCSYGFTADGLVAQYRK